MITFQPTFQPSFLMWNYKHNGTFCKMSEVTTTLKTTKYFVAKEPGIEISKNITRV